MNSSKIAPLAPLSLTPSNSKGKGGLAPLAALSTPLSTDKLEKPKSRGDKSASKSNSEKKKARKLKMEKLRQTKYATQIQAVWRGKLARKHGLQPEGDATRQAKSYFLNSCEKSMKNMDLKESNPETETVDGLSLTRKDTDEENNRKTVELSPEKELMSTEIKQDSNNVTDSDLSDGKKEKSDQPVEISPPVVEELEKQSEDVEEKETVSLALKETASHESNIDSSTNTDMTAAIIDKHIQPDKKDDQKIPDSKEEEEKVEVQEVQQQQPGGSSIEEVQEPSKWPDSDHDTFTTIGDTSIPWPNLADSSSGTVLQWVLEHQQVLIRTVTWNMQANDPPDVNEVRKQLLPLNRSVVI